MAEPIAFDTGNIFQKIVAGQIPSYKIFETEDVLAILDAFPSTPGHSLLIPKASGYAAVEDMPTELAAKVFAQLPRLCKAVRAATGAEGVNILINNGAAAGQVVFHVHIHVVPRVGGDELFRFPASKGMIAGDAATAMLASMHPHV